MLGNELTFVIMHMLLSLFDRPFPRVDCDFALELLIKEVGYFYSPFATTLRLVLKILWTDSVYRPSCGLGAFQSLAAVEDSVNWMPSMMLCWIL